MSEPSADIPYQRIVEASVSPFVVIDGDGFVRWAGPTVEVLLGRPASDYVGVHFLDVIDPACHADAIAAFTDFVRPERGTQDWIGPPMLLDLVGSDGPVTCEVSATSGSTIGFDGALLQVRRWRGTVLLYQAVDAIAGAASLHEALLRLVELVEHDMPQTRAAIATGWQGDRFGDVVATDDIAAELVRHHAGPSPWRTAMSSNDLVDDPGGLILEPALDSVAAAAGFQTCWALPILVRRDPEPSAALILWRLVTGRAATYLMNGAERAARLVELAVAAERDRAAWERAARTDTLTGLSNRVELDDRLDAVTRLDPDRPVAALFCDLDDFKPVNDRLGHDAGDAVLTRVADRIRRAVRPSDVVTRWGGDEFVVLCTDPTTAEDAVGIAQRLMAAITRPMQLGSHRLRLGVSVGIATATARKAGPLVRHADGALREAKAAGKNELRIAC